MQTAPANRRLEPRVMCSDLVWIRHDLDGSGEARTQAVLLNISAHGTCFLVEADQPVPAIGTRVLVEAQASTLPCVAGVVRHRTDTEIGVELGVRFDEGCEWESGQQWPSHQLQPQELAERWQAEGKSTR